MVIESFTKVYNDKRITEIVISDDCSDQKVFDDLKYFIETAELEKVKLFRNNTNMGMSVNKQLAIKRATNEWCIIFDSDNVLDRSYVDALYAINWEPDTIYCPEFARPNFDYRMFAGMTFDKESIKGYIEDTQFSMLLNTSNYFVNKNAYLRAFKFNPLIKGSDTIWMALNWLKAGNKFHVVKDLQYEHLVHDGSGFMEHVHYNLAKAEETRKLISVL